MSLDSIVQEAEKRLVEIEAEAAKLRAVIAAAKGVAAAPVPQSIPYPVPYPVYPEPPGLPWWAEQPWMRPYRITPAPYIWPRDIYIGDVPPLGTAVPHTGITWAVSPGDRTACANTIYAGQSFKLGAVAGFGLS